MLSLIKSAPYDSVFFCAFITSFVWLDLNVLVNRTEQLPDFNLTFQLSERE